MELSARSKIVSWGYWGHPPAQTTLCKFFWRVFVLNILLILLAAFLATAISLLAWREPKKFFTVLGGFATVLGLGATAAYLADKAEQRKRHREWERLAGRPVEPDNLFIASLKAVKGKVCPIIRIT